ncbi:GNAT family N-acetyltransferase [Streptomyces sp. NPDC087425]|uniref:GNAT family N-acetyltransferase n=1 Tax=Streptomyces sp. NPDC087425 TaxID=3365787 RepID=UPI003808F3A0
MTTSTTADWTPRPAPAADVEAVAEPRATVLRADLERLGRYDDQRVRQRLRDGFTPAHTSVVEAYGAFAGRVALRPAADGHWLEHFSLAPHLQGRGLGPAVPRTLLRGTDADGVPVRLNVLRGSAARRLCARHGSTVTSEDPVDVFMAREPGTTRLT